MRTADDVRRTVWMCPPAQVVLQHLSPDCQRLLKKAGNLVKVEVLEDDPAYPVVADYPDDYKSYTPVNF